MLPLMVRQFSQDKDTAEGSGPGVTWASTGMQGWRVTMEDAHVTLPDLGHHLQGVGSWAKMPGG